MTESSGKTRAPAPHLADVNRLVLGDDGVWVPADAELKEFGYSDGADAEALLTQALESAVDRTSASPELEQRIQDWPSEYHLSYRRGNLLRILDAGKTLKRVLEPGCGCGAISRYLGEQGVQVDSIEGSRVRAGLAARRTQDLDNVQITCMNYNDIELPRGAYDAVLFVGVLEYAGRFLESATSHEEAVVSMLRRAREALTDDGVIIVAIENRTGLKYLLGAHEDHYAKRMTGVYGYPDEAGIRTYTRSEWRELVAQAGIANVEFCYPVPDYKVPSVVVRGDWLEERPERVQLLADFSSRDYVAPFEPGADESALWAGMAEAGVVGDVANSFLMVLGTDAATSAALPYDFVHVSGDQRLPAYRAVTAKRRDAQVVTKDPLIARAPTPQSDWLTQRLDQTRWIEGLTLATVWKRDIESHAGFGKFAAHVESFRKLVARSLEDSELKDNLDLLPANVVMDDDGVARIIDREWRTSRELETDYLVFRGLVYFFANETESFRILNKELGTHTLRQLIGRIFRDSDADFVQNAERWVSLEDEFQAQVCGDLKSVSLADALDRGPDDERFESRLYWSVAGEDTSMSASLMQSAVVGGARQKFRYELPKDVRSLQRLRFDPAERAGVFHLSKFTVSRASGTGKSISYASSEIAQHANLINIDRITGVEHDAFVATTDDPVFDIDVAREFSAPDDDRIIVEVELDWPSGDQSPQARDSLIVNNRDLRYELARARSEVTRLSALAEELKMLKGSRVWRAAQWSRHLWYRRLPAKIPGFGRFVSAVSGAGVRTRLAALKNGKLKTALTPPGKRVAPVAARQGVDANRDVAYEALRQRTALDDAARSKIRAEISTMARRPLISIVMPVYNVAPQWLEQAVASVTAQLYDNYELILVDDCSPSQETRAAIDRIHHPRVTVRRLESNLNISGATNQAIRMASGEYIAFFDHDDELTEDALFEVVRAINAKDPDAIYSDEDFISPEGRLINPHFKPDFSTDLLLSHNYITHLTVVRKTLVDELEGLRSKYDGAQDYDFWLRLSERTDSIYHIPRVLYHWRMLEASTSMVAEAKPAALEASRLALVDAMERRGIRGEVLHANIPYFFRIKRDLIQDPAPLVSIVVPFKDKPEFLDSCLGTIIEKSTYHNFEIVGVSNNSEDPQTHARMAELASRDPRVRFVEHNIPFNFSALVNEGVRHSRGEYVVLLNNDVEIITWDWIEAMLEHAQRPEVGVVGGKLYYDNNTVQHAGIIVGIGGYAGHPHKHYGARRAGYFNRAHIQHNLSALTGAFLMVRKEVYEDVGGFNEDQFKVACNDVDFCLRVVESGLNNIFTPYAAGYHYESSSRGYEDTPEKQERFEREKKAFSERHAVILASGDPYYNPNLSLDNEHFGIRL